MLMRFLLASLLAFPQSSLPKDVAGSVNSFLDSQRAEGDGPAIIHAWVAGDWDDDGIEEVVVLFEFAIGPNRDRSHRRYVVAFSRNDPGVVPSEVGFVGAAGTRLPESVTTDNSAIILSGALWKPGDRRCCPSGSYSETFLLQGTELVKKGG